MSKSIPPPGKRLIGDWVGMKVKIRHALHNGYGAMPAGSVATVSSVTSVGLSLTFEHCQHCGIKLYMRRVSTHEIEPA